MSVWPSRRLVAMIVLLAGAVLLAGCSGSDEATRPTVPTRQATSLAPPTPFCAEAVGFNDYLNRFGGAVFEPELAESYLTEAQDRLSAMADMAPTGSDGEPDVAADIFVIQEAYRGLDAEMAAVGYDLLLLDDGALISEPGNDASVRLDDYLFEACGFDPLASLPFEGEAPVVLSDGELTGLLDGDDDAEVVAVLADQFAAEFGLTPTAATCLATNMDRDSVVAIASGAAITEAVANDFTETLDLCDLTPEDVGG